MRRIHWWPVNSPHKGPVTRKMFSFDDVIMSRARPTWSLIRGSRWSGLIKAEHWVQLKYNNSVENKLHCLQACLAVTSYFTYWDRVIHISLQWRHNEHDRVSNHQSHDCLLNRLIRRRSKENIKAPRHWPLCGEFTGDRWIPRTNGQLRGKCFHLMTSSWCVGKLPERRQGT